MSCRAIPVLMATQHPDSTRYIPASEEVEEAVNAFTKYLCDEVMVDYEGKLTPYHQPEWIVEKCAEMGIDIGIRRLITVRIPNDVLEDRSRHMHALLTVFLTNAKAVKLGLSPPVCYVVLPMFENPIHASTIQRRLIKLQLLVEEEMGVRIGTTPTVIPLLEDTSKHLRAGSIAEAFRVSLLKNVGIYLEEMRVFLGKSDAALESGNLASTLSLAVALSSLARWSEEESIHAYPIIGMGKAPFRGFLHPKYVDLWVYSWLGYRTVTIQSALRYDTPYQDYVRTAERLRDGASSSPRILDIEYERRLRELMPISRRIYRERLELIAPIIAEAASSMPRTRDRVPFTIYGRGREGIKLPRAITFTTTCYTLGIPPTLLDIDALIETWRFLENLPQLTHLIKSYEYDLSFYSREIALRWLPRETVDAIDAAVKRTTSELGLRPSEDVDEEYWKHLERAWNAHRDGKAEEFKLHVVEAARIRGFLG